MFSRLHDARARQPRGWLPWLPPALLAGALAWPTAATGYAADPPTSTEHRDVYQTIQARNALLRDPVLGPLNLGVRVRDRVATLWGPVPSAELMARAVNVLRRLPDLAEVRNELHVENPDDLRPQYLPPPVPPQYLPDNLPPVAPAVPPPPPPLPGLAREDGGRDVLTRRLASPEETAAPARSVRMIPAPPPTPGFPAPGSDDQNEAVLPAIAVPQARRAATQSEGWASLQLAVNSLRLADTRFLNLRAEARGGQVLLSGSAASWNDVRDFAAGVNRLPGVERVILGQVQAER